MLGGADGSGDDDDSDVGDSSGAAHADRATVSTMARTVARAVSLK